MKSSFLKIFAGHFQRYLQWLHCQNIIEKRKKQLSSRANHYLAYLTLSTSDHSKTFTTLEGKQKAWRNYRRFLKESMNYSEEGLRTAVDELSCFHDFVANESVAFKERKTPALSNMPGRVLHIQHESRGKRLSARPGERLKPSKNAKASKS